MPTIKKLSPDIIAKIAAGEVIERPAFAVKELIENAIDAHATSITIHIQDAGLKRIQVIDDGNGMSKDDVLLSFLPHTTSKLTDESNLIGIETLGFRGEALSSIASISHLILQSRTKHTTAGTEIEIRNGKVEHVGSTGMPIGTIVTVDNLFYTVPARKKFLKKDKTEFRHISEVVMQFVVSFPNIHFLLTHNKKVLIDIAQKKENHERLSLIFGETVEHFLPLSFSDSYVSIMGYIGKPQIASKQNQKQFIFVNNRVVSDKLISLAVKESFGTLLPSFATPLFSLHITVPFDTVDVNIHPRKEQVSFLNNRHIFDLVKQAVTQTLLENNITYSLETFDNSIRKGETLTYAAHTLKDVVLPWNRTDIGEIQTNKHLVQVHQTYIFGVTKEGMVLMDQHGAHERILYENFLQAFENEKQKKQIFILPKPYTISVSLIEKQLLFEYQDVFKHIGFSFETFGNTTFLLREVPLLFKGRKVEKIIKDMLSDLSDGIDIKSIDSFSRKMLAFLSCRAAVKAGDTLTTKQMKKIVEDLEKTKNNATCPHGRPTKTFLSLEILHKQFRR